MGTLGPGRCANADPSTSICCRRAMPDARPARTSRPGWRTPPPGGTKPRGVSSSRTTRSPQSTAGCAITRVKPSATEPISTARCRSIRWSGSSATWPGSAAGCSNHRSTRTGKRVLVVGAGPSGLSAAYHLARLGHEVEIRDAGAAPGGMMRYGIPSYRLPRDVLDDELNRIAAMGVRVTCDHRVDDLAAERDEGGFDAVFVAIGAHLAKRVDIPARDAGTMVDAVSFLRSVASGEKPVIGRHVAVYGGGNTAMDAARVARRLGAEDAVIVYRRTREQMPAHAEEAEDAEREGVRINWLRTITAFDGPELRVEVMELDDSGYPRPTGRFETLAADTLIMAIGQETESAFMRTLPGVEFDADGSVRVSASLMTGCPGVFAGGDMVPSERTVTVGVGHGKKAAHHIDAWLRGAPADTAGEAPDGDVRRAATSGTSVTPRNVGSPNSSRRNASRVSRRSSADCPPTRRPTRPGVACRVATASNATAASARAPRTR